MSGWHNKNSKQRHSPLKTVLGKIEDRYKAHCTLYKMYVMPMHHRGAGCPVDRDMHLHIDGTWPPQQTYTQQPSQVNSTYDRNT